MQTAKAQFNEPLGLRNAHVEPGLKVRVGIPSTSGKLAFHAFNEGYSTMVSAQAFWNPSKQQFRVPAASDLFETDFALDSAGFTAQMLFKARGPQPGMANVFPWTFGQYLQLAAELRPAWYSAPDLCCEPEIAGSQEIIDYRIDATATLLEGCLRILYEWSNELAKSCSNEVVRQMIAPPVPVIQGRKDTDYVRSLELTMQVWDRWAGWLAPPDIIGIGSVCRRDIHHPTHGLLAILAGLEGRIPTGTCLHGFGLKGAVLKQLKMMPQICSTDSMAYDSGARRKAYKEGRSNTIASRSAEMTRWMSSALTKAAPAAGDQFRLF